MIATPNQLVRSIAQALFFLLLWPVCMLPAQVSATGVFVFVADDESGAPIVQARVEFPELGLSHETDQFGAAYFPTVRAGVVRIKVLKIGYIPVERDVSLEPASAKAFELSVAMKKFVVARTLDTVTVIAKAPPDAPDDFARRRQLGLGRFLTSTQLGTSPHESLADQLARRIPGIRAVWTTSRMGVRLVSLRGPIRFYGETQCFVRVYVDDHKVESDYLAHIQSGDVAGVEYYSIAPPPQYNVNAPCGVLLVWTKP